MNSATRVALFDLVAELGKSLPFRSSSVSERFGLDFKPNRSARNPHFHFYRALGTAKPPFSGIIVGAELREPIDAPAEGRVNGLLSLDIIERLCISQDEVQKRFGLLFELVLPSPHGSPTDPIYWAYSQDGYKLSFGFSRSEPACLVSVTINSIDSRDSSANRTR